MEEVVQFIDAALMNRNDVAALSNLKKLVNDWSAQFPLYPEL
jgi:glycine/serine hydroxymethyltransferase